MLSSLGPSAVAQSQVLRDFGFISKSGKITAENITNYKVTREEKGGEKSEECHHQKGRKAGEKQKTFREAGENQRCQRNSGEGARSSG